MSVGGVDVRRQASKHQLHPSLFWTVMMAALTWHIYLHFLKRRRALISECIKKKLKFPKREKAPEGTQNAPQCSKIEKVHKKYLAKSK